MERNHWSTKAVIFDFDGLILDTETPELVAWEQAFSKVGGVFDRQAYLGIIGTFGDFSYQPDVVLASYYDNEQEATEAVKEARRHSVELITAQKPLPGVEKVLREARQLGMRTAIGSSSPSSWVVPHVRRLGLLEQFDLIVTFDDVNRSKPAPDIYLKVLEGLGVKAADALVLEDSQNGVVAANLAGIPVMAVPNLVTQGQDFSGAVAVLKSLEDVALRPFFEAKEKS